MQWERRELFRVQSSSLLYFKKDNGGKRMRKKVFHKVIPLAVAAGFFAGVPVLRW